MTVYEVSIFDAPNIQSTSGKVSHGILVNETSVNFSKEMDSSIRLIGDSKQ